MGSGHILIAMFDVLMDIYESVGYDKREAAFEIIEHNIHGLDIDQRAYQLAYFAVMMKGRGYSRRFLRGRDGKPEPKVYAIIESNDINRNHLQFFGTHLNKVERKLSVMQIEGLLDTFKDAREYGSILNVGDCDWNVLEKFVDDLDTTGQISFESVGSEETQENLRKLIRVTKNLGQKYNAVVTNPPYLSNSRFSPVLDKYVKENYPEVKTDLSMIMYKHSLRDLCKCNGYVAFITTSSWMFLSSFEKLRLYVMNEYDFSSIVDFGTELFEGKVGHNRIVAWVNRKSNTDSAMIGIRLVDFCYSRRDEKRKEFFNYKNYYYINPSEFFKIPGSPIAYWLNESFINNFSMRKIRDNYIPKFGMSTGDSERFIRFWYEIDYIEFDYESHNIRDAKDKKLPWVALDKGGPYRKWYGNRCHIVWWENDGKDIRECKKSAVRSPQYFFTPHISWTLISSGHFSARYFENGFALDTASNCIYFKNDKSLEILGFLNSKVADMYLEVLNPTMNFSCGIIGLLPYEAMYSKIINDLVTKCIEISKNDWNSSEISWDYQHHPLFRKVPTIAKAFEQWNKECDNRFTSLKINEEELNRIFIDIYGLQNELTPEVEDKDITIHKANLDRDIHDFISYAVGCMFGRYSLDEDGLIYAGGEWDNSSYKTFLPDDDNCIPITDEEYFSDDIVGRFVEFVRTVYGVDTLEENLDFIANALGNKGATSREVIRNYFLKDFYKDHLKIYQKRPIYWMFDSGKQNGFKALIYMHRYDADTVGRVRTDYLHQAQRYVETAMQSAQYTIDNASSASEKSKATKAVTKYTKQLAEMKIYDEAIAHIANQRIKIDLDDGVKVNYAKFQGVEVAQEGKKALKVDLLAKIK